MDIGSVQAAKGAYGPAIYKFGFNAAISTDEETVWDAGGVYSYPSSAGSVTVVSTDAADDIGGTGAEKITIEGLDENWLPKSLEVDMDGTSNSTVATDAASRRNGLGLTASSGLTLLVQLILVGLSMGTGILTARLLGPEGKGGYSLLILGFTLATMVFGAGGPQFAACFAGKGTYPTGAVLINGVLMSVIGSGLAWIVTVVFVLEPADGKRFVEGVPGTQCLILGRGKERIATKGWPA